MKQHFQLYYLITVLGIFTTPTNSGCFINVYQTNPISWKQKYSGGKHSKIRITALAAANAVGYKLFVIGKAKNPRCFKNIKKLPCRYQSQRKSWMDSVLLEDWVRDVNKKFQAKGRNVALIIIDSCAAYPIFENLSDVKKIFATEYYISESGDGSRRNKMSQGPLQQTIS